MKTMSFDNRYAFICGVAVYAWQSLLNIPTDLVVGVVKAALFGVGGMVGKELYTYIRRVVVNYIQTRKSKKDVGKTK
jgi:ABC-type Mn2+/Zn2+ transport system permease subunit